jgi:hypothetical protein
MNAPSKNPLSDKSRVREILFEVRGNIFMVHVTTFSKAQTMCSAETKDE